MPKSFKRRRERWLLAATRLSPSELQALDRAAAEAFVDRATWLRQAIAAALNLRGDASEER